MIVLLILVFYSVTVSETPNLVCHFVHFLSKSFLFFEKISDVKFKSFSSIDFSCSLSFFVTDLANPVLALLLFKFFWNLFVSLVYERNWPLCLSKLKESLYRFMLCWPAKFDEPLVVWLKLTSLSKLPDLWAYLSGMSWVFLNYVPPDYSFDKVVIDPMIGVASYAFISIFNCKNKIQWDNNLNG